MPRIRYLKPEFFKDEDLATLNFQTRLFFAGLWNFADKLGRLEERPLRLKVEIFPYDNVDINNCLDLLSKPKNGSGKPFIQRYEIDGQKYIQILKWEDHQKPHHTEKESTIPAPNAAVILKGMEKGMGKQHEASKELSNGYLTVKDNNHLKIKHLDFVFLTEVENNALVEKYGKPAITAMIERLNNYVGSTGKKYKSHYHTILAWFEKEKVESKKGDTKWNKL